MSDTPRTDAVEVNNTGLPCGSANLNFARLLERELAAAKSETITARVNHLATMRQLAKAKDALRLICDHNDFDGGCWSAEEARRALESIEGDK